MIIPGIMMRLATIPVITAMSVAALIVHAGDPFSGREMALLYLTGFLAVLILGPGRYSTDQLSGGNRHFLIIILLNLFSFLSFRRSCFFTYSNMMK